MVDFNPTDIVSLMALLTRARSARIFIIPGTAVNRPDKPNSAPGPMLVVEDKVRREFVGGSQGVSVRVTKGVYYRVGAFKGHAVEHTESVHIDTGWVFVTNKNIYFAGPKKSLRLPYAKIVSFQSFSDGIGVTRDAATAKAQSFLTGEGWFTYNLVTNLSKL